MKLVVTNHNRDIFKTRYVYPVVSRRAGGLSLGINLNTNNACNWQCVYCEVPNLTRGKPDPIDLNLLRSELKEISFINIQILILSLKILLSLEMANQPLVRNLKVF
jgi:wyosine [tRNA(Phe)-imidazoG37] synthetase (radical SAM superfamily)